MWLGLAPTSSGCEARPGFSPDLEEAARVYAFDPSFGSEAPWPVAVSTRSAQVQVADHRLFERGLRVQPVLVGGEHCGESPGCQGTFVPWMAWVEGSEASQEATWSRGPQLLPVPHLCADVWQVRQELRWHKAPAKGLK